MIKQYNLLKEGLEFKADFNRNFELCQHLLQVRTNGKYFKVDLVQNKKTKKFCFVKRIADFANNKALLEIIEVDSEHKHNYYGTADLTQENEDGG